MDDKISFTMKIMLLMAIEKARLQPPGEMKNNIWKVPFGSLTPSDYKGVRKLTMNA